MLRVLRWLWALTTLLMIAAAAVVGWWIAHPLPLKAPTVEVSIEPGTPPREVAQAWVQAGVDSSPLALYEWFRWSGLSRRIRAGSYEVGQGITPYQLLQKMVQGDETLEHVRLIEGWTFKQWRAELGKAPSLKHTTAAMSDADVMKALGAPGVLPEGRFFPDTYAYSKGVSDLTVMKRAFRAMQRKLSLAWEQRAADTPLKSADEALTLASIVEKETGVSSDRGMVSGVFTNRLRLGMPLQTDPTVIYGLGDRYDGKLHKADLQADGPYNTYTRAGLPPTPIAMPGMASLVAAVQPTKTKALYFVSRGDGTSKFSESLAEHNRAVDTYQRGSKP
jgi:UPF0755 protein